MSAASPEAVRDRWSAQERKLRPKPALPEGMRVETPPAATRRGRRSSGKWAEVFTLLTAYEGDWVLLGVFSPTASTTLRKHKALPPGRFEFVHRTENAEGQAAPEKRAWIYGRYLGAS